MKKLLAIAFFFLSPLTAYAAVARTAHAVVQDNSSGGTTNTISFDCNGGSSLVAYTEDAVNTAGDTTGVTYNGVSLTKVTVKAPPSQNREVVSWYLQSPATGGAHNLVATRTTGSGRFVMSAFCYSGTDTTQTITDGDGYGTGASATSGGVTLSFTNVTGAAPSMFCKATSGGQAGSTGATLISTLDINSDYEASTIPATANWSMSATWTSSGYACVGIAFKPGASAAASRLIVLFDSIF